MAPQPRYLESHAAARQLRAIGLPMKQIASRLGVSSATVHAWTSDIELSAAQLERNRRGPGGPQHPSAQRRRAAAWAARCRAQRVGYQEEGRIAAHEGDFLHQAGCMLYWAEGGKDRNSAKLSNSDPHILTMWRRFLTETLAIERDELSLSINAYTNNGFTIDDIEAFWLEHLDLPRCVLRKHTVNHYGVCSLSIHCTWVVQHIYGAIQEYADFEEPRWLD